MKKLNKGIKTLEEGIRLILFFTLFAEGDDEQQEKIIKNMDSNLKRSLKFRPMKLRSGYVG